MQKQGHYFQEDKQSTISSPHMDYIGFHRSALVTNFSSTKEL